MAKGDIPNTQVLAPYSSSGGQMQSTGNSAPLWQQLSNMNLSYPTSSIQQTPNASYSLLSGLYPGAMNQYSMLPLMGIMGNPAMQYSPSITPATSTPDLGALMQGGMSPSQSTLPSTSLMNQYFSQVMSPIAQLPGSSYSSLLGPSLIAQNNANPVLGSLLAGLSGNNSSNSNSNISIPGYGQSQY